MNLIVYLFGPFRFYEISFHKITQIEARANYYDLNSTDVQIVYYQTVYKNNHT